MLVNLQQIYIGVAGHCHVGACTANDIPRGNFLSDFPQTEIASTISSDLTTDPTRNIRVITNAFEKRFLEKRVDLNKHKRKLSEWVTLSFLYSNEFPGSFHRRLIELLKQKVHASTFLMWMIAVNKIVI